MFRLDELNQILSQLKETDLSFDGYFQAFPLVMKMIVIFLVRYLAPVGIALLCILILALLYAALKWMTIHCFVRAKKGTIRLYCRIVRTDETVNGAVKNRYQLGIDESLYDEITYKRWMVIKITIMICLILIAILGLPVLVLGYMQANFLAILSSIVGYVIIGTLFRIVCTTNEKRIFFYDEPLLHAKHQAWELKERLNKKSYTDKNELLQKMKDAVKNEPYITVDES